MSLFCLLIMNNKWMKWNKLQNDNFIINVKNIAFANKEHTLGLENGNLGFIETLHIEVCNTAYPRYCKIT